MWVKICGNTNLEDAMLAARLGADAVGFVFAPSVRQVTPKQVAAITPHLPSHVDRVGVFAAWSADQIVSTAHEAGLTTVQLHGVFDPALARAVRHGLSPDITLIQALHWTIESPGGNAAPSVDQFGQIADAREIDHILVDSKVGSATGGTGLSFDWDAARAIFATYPGLILAGGLKPQNIWEAAETLHPWGVDVASGVEAIAGKKDPVKLEQFIAEAKCF